MPRGTRGLTEAMETLRGSVPDVVRAGNEDAATFLKLNAETRRCESQPMVHMYKQLAEVALERRKLPADVDDDKGFLEMMSPAMQAKYAGGFAGRPSAEMQERLQKVKAGCLGFAKRGTAEGFCRCQVNAAKESKLGAGDMDLLGGAVFGGYACEGRGEDAGYLRMEQACSR